MKQKRIILAIFVNITLLGCNKNSHDHNNILWYKQPATKWKEGCVKGLKARGDIAIDLYWSDNKLTKAILKSTSRKNIQIRYKGEVTPIRLSGNRAFIFDTGY